MKKSEVVHAWARILVGRPPSLSIEITKECPLRCPGCYAFDSAHLGGKTQLRELSDFKGDQLVQRVLDLLDVEKPLHVSLVGGDPLVRHRELELLLPQIEARGIHTQIVTSAFRVIPAAWKRFKKLNIVVSIDGLQPEHDERRKPATYERILKNIQDVQITIHCTITAQIADRPGYLDQFLRFWSSQPSVAKVWFSLFTPQRGATDPEILTQAQRVATMIELHELRKKYPILDMPDIVINEISSPPKTPEECIFARTTMTVSADLSTKITPCQFGGNPGSSARSAQRRGGSPAGRPKAGSARPAFAALADLATSGRSLAIVTADAKRRASLAAASARSRVSRPRSFAPAARVRFRAPPSPACSPTGRPSARRRGRISAELVAIVDPAPGEGRTAALGPFDSEAELFELWGPGEAAFALACFRDEWDTRGHAASIYRGLRALPDDHGVGELAVALAGEQPICRTACRGRASASRARRRWFGRALTSGSSGGVLEVRVVSSERTDLDRSEAYRRFCAENRAGESFLSRQQRPAA